MAPVITYQRAAEEPCTPRHMVYLKILTIGFKAALMPRFSDLLYAGYYFILYITLRAARGFH